MEYNSVLKQKEILSFVMKGHMDEPGDIMVSEKAGHRKKYHMISPYAETKVMELM
jgi:hypothetical protein